MSHQRVAIGGFVVKATDLKKVEFLLSHVKRAFKKIFRDRFNLKHHLTVMYFKKDVVRFQLVFLCSNFSREYIFEDVFCTCLMRPNKVKTGRRLLT